MKATCLTSSAARFFLGVGRSLHPSQPTLGDSFEHTIASVNGDSIIVLIISTWSCNGIVRLLPTLPNDQASGALLQVRTRESVRRAHLRGSLVFWLWLWQDSRMCARCSSACQPCVPVLDSCMGSTMCNRLLSWLASTKVVRSGVSCPFHLRQSAAALFCGGVRRERQS